jgi:LysR family transcriptional regulator, glycine cleavage system transcriptional activator
MTRIPGLGALRTLEAAGRLMSFTKAAGELGVTPAAVSHQIREFEDHLGLRLFERTSRTMHLTPAGRSFHEAVSEALATLSRAVARLQRSGDKQRLRVTALPSITAKWLVPRLDGFLKLAPGADVRIDISLTPADFSRDDIDIAIRFGDGAYPGMKIDRLFEETVFPVCSPALLSGTHALREPQDLLRHTLIHVDWEDQGLWPNWRMWMLAAGVKDFDDQRGLHFSVTSLAIQAAIDGHGVALGDSTLVADDLSAGRLVQPFDMTLKAPPQFAYYVISPMETAEEPMVRAFRDWLLSEAARASPPSRPERSGAQSPGAISSEPSSRPKG